jgi:hypothetical protein
MRTYHWAFEGRANGHGIELLESEKILKILAVGEPLFEEDL